MPDANNTQPKWDWKAVSAIVAVLALLLSIGVYLARAHAAYNNDQEHTASRINDVEQKAARERLEMQARICVLENIADKTKNLPEQVSQQTVILQSIQGTLVRWEDRVFNSRGRNQ